MRVIDFISATLPWAGCSVLPALSFPIPERAACGS